MTPVQTIIAKELRCYFVSPIIYVVGGVFVAIAGFLAYLAMVNAGHQAVRMMQIQNTHAQLNLNDLVFRPVFDSLDIVLLLTLPLLTMRLFAEERKLRTFELLITSPVGINEIVSAKFMSVFVIYLGFLTLTGLTPLLLAHYINFNFDWNPVLTGYMALALQGGLFLAMGVLGSALTENQIVAAFLSFGLILAVWLLGGLGSMLGDTVLGATLSYLSFTEHYDRLVRGFLDIKDIVYYVSGTVLMLFVAHRVIESNRW